MKEELRRIQIAILNDVASFCDENGITYFLSYGTLLGAIRHNGFIPWDDDIDIAMPRPDYNRFVNLYNNRKSDYKVLHFSIDNSYKLPFAKVHDTRTVMWEYLYKQNSTGVFVDVFPLDGVPQHGFYRFINRWLTRFLNTKAAVNYSDRSIAKNIIINIGKVLLLPIPTYKILQCMEKIGSLYDYKSSVYVGLTILNVKEIINKSYFEETINHIFEGNYYKIPKGYDPYLRQLYGDYMTPPSEGERESTHKFIAWWKE